jgi:hypothetical protein
MDFEPDSKREITLDVGKVSIQTLGYSILGGIILSIPFFVIWSDTFKFSYIFRSMMNWQFTVAIILGIPIHELLHGLFFSIFAPSGFRSVKFGVMWEYMSPYCTCTKALKLRYYLIAAAAPGVILGILPLTLAFIIGRFDFFAFGIIYIMGAGADFMMIWILRNEKKDKYVLDHATKAGCWIYDK